MWKFFRLARLIEKFIEILTETYPKLGNKFRKNFKLNLKKFRGTLIFQKIPTTTYGKRAIFSRKTCYGVQELVPMECRNWYLWSAGIGTYGVQELVPMECRSWEKISKKNFKLNLKKFRETLIFQKIPTTMYGKSAIFSRKMCYGVQELVPMECRNWYLCMYIISQHYKRAR